MLVPLFFAGNIPKSFDYMPMIPNKVVSVDPEGVHDGPICPPPIMIVTNKSTSAYVYAILNISDLIFSPNHMCLLSVNAMTLPLTYFENRIMPERLYDNKSTLNNSPPPLLKLKLLRPQCQIIDVKFEKLQ